MMNLKRVTGSNFCQYTKIDQTLRPGLTCMLGSNGSGKSNFIRAIYLGLVGEVYGTPNLVKDGYQRGFVSLDIQVPQGELTVTRKLKHNPNTRGTSISHELEADFLDEPLKKKSEIQAFLAPYIGVPVAALEHLSFALQGNFGELMLTDHMTRARMLNTIMGLERAEKLREILKNGISSIADIPDKSDAIEDMQAKLKYHEDNRPALAESLEKLQNQINQDTKTAYAKAQVVMTKPLATERDQQIESYRSVIQEAEKVSASLITELEAIPDAATVVEPDHAGAQAHRDYNRILGEIAEVEAEAIKLEEDRPSVVAAPEDREEELKTLHHEGSKLRDKLDSYGTGVCPTCNREYDEKLDKDKLQAELNKLREDYRKQNDEYTAAKKAYDEYIRALAVYTDAKRRNEARTEELAKKLATLIDQRAATFDMAAYNQAVAASQKALSDATARSVLKDKIHEAQTSANNGRNAIEVLKNQDVATPVERATAEALIKAYEDTEAKIKAKADELQALDANIGRCQAYLDVLLKDQQQRQINQESSDILQFARDQLHAEKLPRLAAQGSIAAINRAMKKYLDMFAFPYGFRLTQECDFVVDFDQSKDHPAGILSGGEHVRAALAMRFALLDVFSAGCGVLVLDEPTTALDKDAITALIEVLEVANVYFKDRNIKILTPTHDQQLESVGDNTITIT